jgi:hypothetical protein
LCTVLRQRRRRRLLDDRDDQRSAVISSVISHQSSVICHLYIPVHHSAACTASCPAPSAKKNRMFGDTVRFAAAATRAGSSKPVSTSSARTSSSSPITATPTSLTPDGRRGDRGGAAATSRFALVCSRTCTHTPRCCRRHLDPRSQLCTSYSAPGQQACFPHHYEINRIREFSVLRSAWLHAWPAGRPAGGDS